jgi:hypothetical protein
MGDESTARPKPLRGSRYIPRSSCRFKTDRSLVCEIGDAMVALMSHEPVNQEAVMRHDAPRVVCGVMARFCTER